MKQEAFIEGTRCNCKFRPLLDEKGLHLVSGCGKDGYRNQLHDSLAYCLKDFYNYAGIMARREEPHCFKHVDVNNNMRPDISLFNIPTYTNKLIIDVSVTSPIPPNNQLATMSKAQALIPFRQAIYSFKNKMKKYENIAKDNNLSFMPCIFESTGKIHPESFKLLTLGFKQMSSKDTVKFSSIKFFWMAKISCTFQKCVANSILSHSALINGSYVNENNFQYNVNYIEDFANSY